MILAHSGNLFLDLATVLQVHGGGGLLREAAPPKSTTQIVVASCVCSNRRARRDHQQSLLGPWAGVSRACCAGAVAQPGGNKRRGIGRSHHEAAVGTLLTAAPHDGPAVYSSARSYADLSGQQSASAAKSTRCRRCYYYGHASPSPPRRSPHAAAQKWRMCANFRSSTMRRFFFNPLTGPVCEQHLYGGIHVVVLRRHRVGHCQCRPRL